MHAQKSENTIPTSRPEVLGYLMGSCMLPVSVQIPFEVVLYNSGSTRLFLPSLPHSPMYTRSPF